MQKTQRQNGVEQDQREQLAVGQDLGERIVLPDQNIGSNFLLHPLINLSDEEKLNVEISENEVRKDFSKAERIDYARRLEKIEAAKAKERMVEGRNQYSSPRPNSDEPGRTDETIASKLGIGSGETYRKEKFIVDNQSSLTPEDFADWDEGKLSTNKAFNRIKEKLKVAEEILFMIT